jgi:methylated-DNA-[protein]-cysteine S-methyltransferase
MIWSTYESPLGPLTLVAGGTGLREVHFPGRAAALDPGELDHDSFREVHDQLDEYFAGARKTFELALDLTGTPFQQQVWRASQALPYGRVTTYGELARELDVGGSETLVTGRRTVSPAQKVGWAIGATPTPIIVPCHRVVGANGSLTGYRGGLHRKRQLLDFEAAGAGRATFWSHRGQLALL